MSNEVSPEVLEELPVKVLPFLRAIATNASIRSTLASCGFTEQEQALGWKLLLEVSGYTSTAPFIVTDDQKARDAIAELDAADEPTFRRIHAALNRLHPAEDSFLFSGIEPAKGVGSIASVAMLLDRMDALENSPERASTRDADHAALATLEKRGIDATFRGKLRELVSVAQQAKPVAAPVLEDPSARQQKLGELHAWFMDWSNTARAVIRRRDHLILMGFAKAKRGKVEDDNETETETETVTPPAAPAPVTTPASAPANNGATPVVVA